MNMPRVSVVMPSYNHAKFLRAAIDSVLSQDYPALDLLVMDGGSHDETVGILTSYGDRLQFVSEQDRGQADAINRGFTRVSGDILCWLNSDDMFLPGAILRVVRAFEESPQAGFVYGRGWDIDETGQVIADTGVLTFDLWKLIHQRNFIHQPSCFFRRSLIERAGSIDESLHYVMDWDLWIRFAAYRGLYVDDFWSCNRVYRNNKTQSGRLRRWAEIRRMIRRYTDARWPPVVWLYLLEAILQLIRAHQIPGRLEPVLLHLFNRGMRQDMSGRYADRGVSRRFRFSVVSPFARHITLTLSPLSRYDRSRCGAEPVIVRWRASGGGEGVFTLLETGAEQQVVISPNIASPFIHITCWSDHPGVAVGAGGGLPARRIVGFLDDVQGSS
jgi:GT2 family glycosyltransferase